MTLVPWHRRSFFVGKISINARVLRDPFLVGFPSIRVSHGAQGISLYIHAWRPSKKPRWNRQEPPLLPSTSFVNSSSRQGGLVVQDKVVGFEGRLVVFHLVRLTSSLTLMALSYMDITKITLISCPLLHGPVNFS